MCSIGKFACATGVVGFIRVGLVQSGVLLLCSGSFGLLWIHSGAPLWSSDSIRARPRCRRVHSCVFGSFGRAQEVVGFIAVLLLHSEPHQGFSSSFGFVSFIRARPGCRRFHSDAFSSFGCVPGAVGFIRAGLGRRRVYLDASQAFIPFCLVLSRGRLVHSRASPAVDFGARPLGRLVHAGSFGSCGRFPGVIGLIRVD